MMRVGLPYMHEQKKVRKDGGWGARRVMGVIEGGAMLAAPRRPGAQGTRVVVGEITGRDGREGR